LNQQKQKRRVAVTGLGIASAIGTSLPVFKQNLFAGVCGIGPVSLFNTSGYPGGSGAQIRDSVLEAVFSPWELRRYSRCDLVGLLAAKELLSDPQNIFRDCLKEKIGVVLGGGAGGMLTWERHRQPVWLGKKSKPAALLSAAAGNLADRLANQYGLTGYRGTIATACSSSATAVGYGFDLIHCGEHEMALVGGSEAFSELTFSGFNALRVVDPEYCKPFDKNRQGLSLGEGAAILVLEEYERAVRQGKTIYAEVLGYATNSDAFHMTAPHPEGTGMMKVMGQALKNAGIAPEEVDYINAHGTATRANDQSETLAIKRLFGEHKARRLAISSTKSMVGHCLGAAGAVESLATVLALAEQKAPPTIHYTEPDPACDLDYVPNQARSLNIKIALSNSFAFGGNNTTVVFKRAEH
jgi:3-oxoacyl-[acyl-carrier-protein] synthase II